MDAGLVTMLDQLAAVSAAPTSMLRLCPVWQAGNNTAGNYGNVSAHPAAGLVLSCAASGLQLYACAESDTRHQPLQVSYQLGCDALTCLEARQCNLAVCHLGSACCIILQSGAMHYGHT